MSRQEPHDIRRRRARARGAATAAGALLSVVALLGPPASAAPSTAESIAAAPAVEVAVSVPTSTDSEAVQAMLDALVANGATGALALVDDGERTWQLASGVPRLDAEEALRPDARFRIGSLTKTFVATVALQLAAEGRLGLDDPVSRWLPDLLPNGSVITLRMLLNHTSGLFNYTSSPVFQEWAFTTPTRPLTVDDLVALATAQPATFPPGEGWSYSNTGYLVAGLMIEAAAGRDIEILVRDRILEPLNLSDTSFPRRAPNISGYHASGYLPPSLTGEGYLDVTRISPTLTWAAGAMISTADDVRRFFAALLGGELLTPAMLAEMLTTVPVDAGWEYGLGIESMEYTCSTVWGHRGSIQGYFTLAYNDVSGDSSALMMMSTRPDQTLLPLQHAALDMAICQMLDRTPPAPDDEHSIPPMRVVTEPFA